MKKILASLVLSLFCSIVMAEERVALVIGNNAYQHIKPLTNPITDAKAIAAELKTLGFQLLRPVRNTDVQNNLTQEELIKAKNALQRAASGTEIAFLFYAGHGASLGSKRAAHIIPTDVKKPSADRDGLELFEKQSMSLESLLIGLDDKAKLTVAVFDACREIPELEANRSVFDNWLGKEAYWRGLARPKQGKKRIIAYSAAIGQLAADGSQQHSPYTSRLLDVLRTQPNYEVGNLFRAVASEVESYTGQQPEVLIQGVPPNRFYFASKNDPEKEFWLAMQSCNSLSCYQAYEKKYPNGKYIQQAQKRIASLTNTTSFEPEMVLMPTATFKMGCVSGQHCSNDERPVRKIHISAFYMGKYEVTFEQWDACIKAGGCAHKPSDNDWGRGKRPVINVSWDDAQAYVQWLSKKTGRKYRLPSEAEWEYAARAGSSSKYPWGNELGSNQANCSDCGSQWDNKSTATVGSFPAHGGLYDMQGNVWEWVQDCYHKSYDDSPTDGSAWETHCDKHGEEKTPKMLRGGSWDDSANNMYSAYRLKSYRDRRDDKVGFRVARTL